MKIKSTEMIQKFNKILENAQQKIRILEWSGTSILLSNGLKLEYDNRRVFLRRLSSNQSIWRENIDNLLDGRITDKEIKSIISKIGGFSCQHKRKEQGLPAIINQPTIPWNKGKMLNEYTTKGGNLYADCMWQTGQTKETNSKLAKLSRDRTSIGNPMYGKKHNQEVREAKSKLMKEKILKGEFTPNSNNRNTHWNSMLDSKKYRSSWEALYQYYNPAAEYEKLRIPYEYLNNYKIYIVDFIDYTNRILIEVKPKELCNGAIHEAKMIALADWAKINRFTILIANQEWFLVQSSDIDYTRFDELTAAKIKKFYEANIKKRNRKAN
jgi:hypothetical protein